ncbi:MAG: hypothetical protein JXR31_02755, partial [Prolixibacteraceae bacterium]|nr:hypothetical protein [Prolixibacteraceae bacterium]MBN2773142.1 hypothetical protein [Prolixibacteraceae bacterium]
MFRKNDILYYVILVNLLIPQSLFSQEYFQQEVNYKINVTLHDSIHELSGFEEIEYINNSPDDLEFIYFHLWANGFKNNNTALTKQKLEFNGKRELFKIESQRGYIDSLDFKVNGRKVVWSLDSEHIDVCKISLNEPLKSGESIKITTPFHVKIPRGSSSKFGYVAQSYRISQWYPKPAVYDRFSWHPMPNLDIGEFYSEFGSFDVSITLPENYIVAASGNLVTDTEVEWLNKLAEETKVKTDFSRTANFQTPSSQNPKTIRFTEKNIHDFAWFADKNYNVLKSSVKLPHSGRTVTTWAFFPDFNYDYWKNATQYLDSTLYYYSLWYGDYPY